MILSLQICHYCKKSVVNLLEYSTFNFPNLGENIEH